MVLDAVGALSVGGEKTVSRRAQVERSWEGQIGEIPLYLVLGRVGHRYDVEIRAFFGRPHPTAAQRARANAELRRLELPAWTAAIRAQRP